MQFDYGPARGGHAVQLDGIVGLRVGRVDDPRAVGTDLVTENVALEDQRAVDARRRAA